MKPRFFAVAVFFIALGCVHPTVIITGTPRPSISTSDVKVFLEEPKEKYELIGRVDVEVEEGLSKQSDLNTAIDAAKYQAAKVGANAIIIIHRGEKSGDTMAMPVGNSWMAISESNTIISAKMIFLETGLK